LARYSETEKESIVIRVELVPRARITAITDASLGIEVGGQRMNIVGFTDGAKALARLAEGPVGWDDLPRDEAGEVGREVVTALRRFAERALVTFDCQVAGQVALRATPVAGSSAADFRKLDLTERYLLSRFAYLRRTKRELVLESGRSRWRVTVHNPALGSLIAAAARPLGVAEAVTACAGLGEPGVVECLRFLVGIGAIEPLNGQAEPDDERIPELAPREFHDVLMHAECRRGLASQPLGAVFPFAGEMAPPSALRPRTSENVVELPRPDLEAITLGDMPLGLVMERRRSVRQFADRPMTVAELGEFLFRVGRVRAVRKPDPADSHGYETTSRTYPSAGAVYDLEIYLTAWNCEGLGRGLYHYEPDAHALALVTERQSVVGRIVRSAYLASGRQGVPQTVITLSSRFNRLAWKYRGIAYALTLKNVGVLYEAMYLAATAMGLAPCGLGSGDSAVFGEATGADPLVESSVGEFMLGVRAD
jgi:oxazoline/thiazoline dehydrogenase